MPYYHNSLLSRPNREETGEGEHFLNNGISDQKRNKNSVPAQNLYISDTMLKHLCIYLH